MSQNYSFHSSPSKLVENKSFDDKKQSRSKFNLNNPLTRPLDEMSTHKAISTRSTNKSSGFYIYDENYDSKNLKRLLYEDYEAQVRAKKQQERINKQKQLQMEKMLINQNHQMHSMALMNDLQRKLLNQRQIAFDFERKQQINRLRKLQQEQEKARYNQMLSSKKTIDKKAIFKQFYDNLHSNIAENTNVYLQQVQPSHSYRELQKQKFHEPHEQTAKKYDQLLQKSIQQNELKKKSYKMELENQKQQKEHLRRHNSERKLYFESQAEIDRNYHHPILNPVSLGVNPENKYLVRELRRLNQRSEPSELGSFTPMRESRMPNQIRNSTILARNGSQILF